MVWFLVKGRICTLYLDIVGEEVVEEIVAYFST
jgi:hypothetical protein